MIMNSDEYHSEFLINLEEKALDTDIQNEEYDEDDTTTIPMTR